MRDYLRLASVLESNYPRFRKVEFVRMVLRGARGQVFRFQKLGDKTAYKANLRLYRNLVAEQPGKEKVRELLALLMGLLRRFLSPVLR